MKWLTRWFRRKPAYVPVPLYLEPKPFTALRLPLEMFDRQRRAFELPMENLKKFRLLVQVSRIGSPEPFFIDIGSPNFISRDSGVVAVMEFGFKDYAVLEFATFRGQLLVDDEGVAVGSVRGFNRGFVHANSGDTLKLAHRLNINVNEEGLPSWTAD